MAGAYLCNMSAIALPRDHPFGSATMDAPQAIATVHSYDDLIAVARARMDALEITFTTFNWISGVHEGSRPSCSAPATARGSGP